MGKEAVQMRINFLEALRETYVKASKVDNCDIEKALKTIQKIDMRLAILYQELAELK